MENKFDCDMTDNVLDLHIKMNLDDFLEKVGHDYGTDNDISLEDLRKLLSHDVNKVNLDYLKNAHKINVQEEPDDVIRVLKTNEPTDVALSAVDKFIEQKNKREGEELLDPEFMDSAHVTWFAYVAGNWKAMVMSEGYSDYFEVTGIQKQNTIVVDRYDQASCSETFHLELVEW